MDDIAQTSEFRSRPRRDEPKLPYKSPIVFTFSSIGCGPWQRPRRTLVQALMRARKQAGKSTVGASLRVP